MLFQQPKLDPAEEAVAQEVERLRTALGRQLWEPRRWFGSLRRLSFARAIQGSNSIEGFNAALDDVAATVAGEDPLDADTETKLALWGYREAMTYVLQLAEETEFDYSDQLLKSLHFMMTSYKLGDRPGLWRAGNIFVRNDETGEIVYEGPEIEKIPSLIRELVDELNGAGDGPVLVRGAMAHLNLVMIHPFRDGNGRMARCLQTLVIAREGLLAPQFCSIEEYLGRNTQAYYDVLAEVGGGRWQPERDARPWVRFILTAHLRQAQTLLRRVRESEELWSALEDIVRDRDLNERVIPLMFDAGQGFRVRNSIYRAMHDNDISEQTAGRDLKLLVEGGLLEPHGERRGRFYTATEALSEVWRVIRQRRAPRQNVDPFAE